MSDKPKKEEEKKKDAGAAADGHAEGDGAKKKGGIGALLTKLPVLLGGVMVIEAVVLFGGFKMLASPPAAAQGATLTDKPGEGKNDEDGELVKDPAAAAEGGKEEKPDPKAIKVYKNRHYAISVIEFRAPNKTSGKMLIFDVAIEVQVSGEHYYQVDEKLKAQKALISDRIRTIIAQSDPEKLNGQAEPGLETLKRQVRHALEEIVGGHEMIDEVLVPRCIPFRADF